jgi:hypothetical protein
MLEPAVLDPKGLKEYVYIVPKKGESRITAATSVSQDIRISRFRSSPVMALIMSYGWEYP